MLYIDEYIAGWSERELGEEMAAKYYMKILNRKLPAPCGSCCFEYITGREAYLTAYESWYAAYNRRKAAEWEEENGIEAWEYAPWGGIR